MTMTTTLTPEMSTLKTRLKTTWESGDYGVFAKYLEKGALEFFGRLNIPAGTRLLDVACGAGQLTLPAARKGIQVTGLDLAANLVQQARTKAAEEGLRIQVDEGDAENLPYPDASFDVVLSLLRGHVESKAFGIRCSWWVPACARSELWMSMAEPRDGGLRPCGGLIRLLNPRQYRRTSLTKA
jgi:SAM-dependent methyltransferase